MNEFHGCHQLNRLLGIGRGRIDFWPFLQTGNTLFVIGRIPQDKAMIALIEKGRGDGFPLLGGMQEIATAGTNDDSRSFFRNLIRDFRIQDVGI